MFPPFPSEAARRQSSSQQIPFLVDAKESSTIGAEALEPPLAQRARRGQRARALFLSLQQLTPLRDLGPRGRF